tara:strand:- start:868 stop:1623 length:756 start_codon:yes stop_codon:yes gene_type:complete
MNLTRKEKILEQSLTIAEFVSCLVEHSHPNNLYAKRENLQHHNNVYKAISPSSKTEIQSEKNRRQDCSFILDQNIEKSVQDKLNQSIDFTDSLLTRLLHDANLITFPRIQSIDPVLISADLEEENYEFKSNLYKFADLFKWITEEYNIERELIPEYLLSESHYKKLPKGTIEINSLPKLIQLAIKAHEHFNWDDINPNAPTDKYKSTAVKYLNEEAEKLSLSHLFGTNDKLSTKLTDQLVRIIDPNNDSQK